MSTTISPERNNDGFSKVENLNRDALAILAAQHNAQLGSIQTVRASATPTAIGNYALVNSKGNTVSIPETALFLGYRMVGAPTLTSAGAPTFQVGTAATDGGVVGTDLFGAPLSLAAANQGGNVAAAPALRATGEQYLSLTTAVAAVTAGSLSVTVNWIDLQ